MILGKALRLGLFAVLFCGAYFSYLAQSRATDLQGTWVGTYSCPDGEAVFTLTLGPGEYDGRQYSGSLRFSARPGTDGVPDGAYNVIASYDRRNNGVDIVPSGWIERPEPRYEYGAIRSQVSEDGRTITGNPTVWGCEDFVAERQQIASDETSVAALIDHGFSGLWRGEYDCGADTAGLDLAFRHDVISGELRVTWTFYPLATTSQLLHGSYEARVEPLEGVAAARFVPIRWIEQPRGYQSVAASAHIGEDGRMVGQIEFEGCGSLHAARITEGPAVAEFSDADLAFVESLPGRWRGRFSCGGDLYAAQLEVPEFQSDIAEGEFEYSAFAGGTRNVARMSLALRIDPRAGGVEAEMTQLLSYTQGRDPYGPVVIAVDALPSALNITLDTPHCEQVALVRHEPSEPVTVLPVPATPNQSTVFFADANDSARLYRARTPVACAALAEWVALLSEDDAVATGQGMWGSEWGVWPAMFVDDRFTPFFGVAHDRLAGRPDIARMLRSECRQIGSQFELPGPVFLAAFVEDPEVFGSEAHSFLLAIEDAVAADLAKNNLVEAIAAVAATEAGLATLGDLSDEAELSLTPLPHADRAEVGTLIDTRRRDIQRALDDAFLARLADPDELMDLAALIRAEALLNSRDRDERSANRQLITDRLDPIVVASIRDPSSGLRLEALGPFLEEQRQRFASFAEYQNVSDALAAVQAMIESDLSDRVAELDEQIAAVTDLATLQVHYGEISRLAEDPHLASGVRPLWSSFDAQARYLLSEAVADLPLSAPVPEALVSGGRLEGLHQNHLITAFLRGDRLTPYREPRHETLLYLQGLAAEFRLYCPAAMPPGLATAIAGQFFDLGLLAGNRDALAAEGLRAIADGLVALADPGALMLQAIQLEEIRTSAAADTQTLLTAFPCTGTELRTLFENVRTYVDDPTAGISGSDLRLTDVCLSAIGSDNQARAYCDCAAPEIEQTGSSDLLAYLRADPHSRFHQIRILNRGLAQRLQSCHAF